ncbi:TlpA family protein disulfide reductase [Desulfocurvibacter africanus]|uniref:Alkyl hydroperoxide reductase/ Thiol specific antioxidant/ Mal allergen n=1 Tax=Desulfocurvibacter africanus subsp. africanus str. Walvis Bay TaxID=690850 RepID=F3Z3X6_DESAF|nr:TlpA disulfide reductase family protein [Desulfocurvibacter africanus]EGJ50428.1 alkyl hydroperoxide reductase/ Thiol specific antioxidant/ Mal allergen [Desulfocurvibacter africanus subsp. africanus str. Walvis Bay]
MTGSNRLIRLMVLGCVLALLCLAACSRDEGSDQADEQEGRKASAPTDSPAAVEQQRPAASRGGLHDGSNLQTLSYSELLEFIDGSKGKVVLVNFWATWCPPCRQELPELKALREKYSPEQLVVLGVSVDETKEPVRRFMQDEPLNYPVYMSSRELLAAYQVSGVPYTVVYDRNGHQADDMAGYVAGEVEAMVRNLMQEN